jgi:hypothetical protein
MLSTTWVRQHKLSMAITLFLCLMILIHITKPAFIYDDKGRFRSFGLGYRNFTVFPIWLVSIVLAIIAYLAITWYIM